MNRSRSCIEILLGVLSVLVASSVIGQPRVESYDEQFAGALEELGRGIEWMTLPLDCSKMPDPERSVDTILLHFCSDVVANPMNPYDARQIVDGFARFRVSAHFLIDRDGNMLQLVSLDRTAYHAGAGNLPNQPERENRLNEFSIGIELMGIGTLSEMMIYMSSDQYRELDPKFLGYTDEQYDALNDCIAALMGVFPEIVFGRDSIFGHDEWSPGRKTDPGVLFDWERIGLSP